MKKILALLLAFVMVFSVAALVAGCDDGNKKNSSSKNEDEDKDEDETTAPEGGETTAPEGGETTDPGNIESTDYPQVVEIYVSIDGLQLMAYDQGDGTIYVDMTTAELIKRGSMEPSVMDVISKGVATSGYDALEDFYEAEGEGYGSIMISFGDEGYFSTECYGSIPEEVVQVVDALIACFAEATESLPEYIPVPMEMGEIADSDKAALEAILAGLALPAPADTYAINGIVKDEYFASSLGLSSDSGVASGLTFGPMMMGVAYSLNIVTLDSAADAETVAADFENNIDWAIFVCVQPESAVIAVKDNQVLRVLGGEDFFDATVEAIEAAGWTVYSELENPNL